MVLEIDSMCVYLRNVLDGGDVEGHGQSENWQNDRLVLFVHVNLELFHLEWPVIRILVIRFYTNSTRSGDIIHLNLELFHLEWPVIMNHQYFLK